MKLRFKIGDTKALKAALPAEGKHNYTVHRITFNEKPDATWMTTEFVSEDGEAVEDFCAVDGDPANARIMKSVAEGRSTLNTLGAACGLQKKLEKIETTEAISKLFEGQAVQLEIIHRDRNGIPMAVIKGCHALGSK